MLSRLHLSPEPLIAPLKVLQVEGNGRPFHGKRRSRLAESHEDRPPVMVVLAVSQELRSDLLEQALKGRKAEVV
ncbi:hypothetical protein D3C72_2187750 [compost metagenome]